MRGPLPGSLAARVAAFLLVVLAVALPATAGGAPFDPSGVLLEGKEKLPSLGRSPVSLHLGADGTAAASLVDPMAIAIGWTGTWTFEDGLLTLDLEPIDQQGDPVLVELKMKRNGKGKGTVTRSGTGTLVTKLSVKATHPGKVKGWTAVVPRLRDSGTTTAGSYRGTLVLRNLAAPGKRAKALKVILRAVSPGGLPGREFPLEIPPGGTRRLEGFSLPQLPTGVDGTRMQVLVSGRKGFDPGLVRIDAVEEVLRATNEVAISGTSIPVRWVRKLSRKELKTRETSPLFAPWFKDDGGAGALPRDARLVLRDLSPFTRDAPPGTVRVSLRTLAGVEVASSLVDLPRGMAAEVRLLDLLESPGDLPSGEGSLRVTTAAGGDLPRGVLAAALLGTVTSGGTPVAPLSMTIDHPESAGRSARLAAPRILAPDDGLSRCRVVVGSLSTSDLDLPVEVRTLDGELLHSATVALAAGASVSVDPESLGMDLADLPEGEAQVILGDAAGLPVHLFLAHAETRLAGTPDTFLTAQMPFESAHGEGDPLALDLTDAQETQGSGLGTRDALLFLRNGAAAPLSLVFRAFNEGGVPLGSSPEVALTVPGGASLRISVEALLAEAGVFIEPPPASLRVSVEITGAAEGPVAATFVQVRRGLEDTGGRSAAVQTR